MKLSQWHLKFSAAIKSTLVIDEWLLASPMTLNTSTGFIAPIENFTLVETQQRVKADFEQSVSVSYRVACEAYDDLPLNLYEGLLSTVAYRLVMASQSIDESITVVELKNASVGLEELSDAMGSREWVITLNWTFFIVSDLEPEGITYPEPITINQLTAGIYRDGNLDIPPTLDAKW